MIKVCRKDGDFKKVGERGGDGVGPTGSTVGVGQETRLRKEDDAFFIPSMGLNPHFLLLFYSHNLLKDTDDLVSTKCTRHVEPRTVLS